MVGEGRQHKNSIFVGDQLEEPWKVLRCAVKFRSKLPILFAIRLDPPVQAGYFLRVSADKEFALQFGQSHSIPGRKTVLIRKCNVTARLRQRSRVKFAG